MNPRGAVELRALRPPPAPNDNDPVDTFPNTVGPPTAVPGDPNGVVIVEEGTPTWRGGPPRPMAWSGWPAEWDTPNWFGQWANLTDTAWACLDLNSSLLGTMPVYLVGAADYLPATWLENPDPDLYASWAEFAKQLFWDFMLGEAFVLTTARYGSGWPARFHVVPPWMVNVELIGGIRRYSIGTADVTEDLLHVRYKSAVDDAHGHGPLEAGGARLVAARLLAQYASNLVAGGGVPNAVLTHPDELTADQSAALQAQWVAARMASMGLPAVLSGGVTFETLQFSPQDMAMLELSQWNESRICVLLGVPPFLMGLPSGGDSMTYSNVVSLFDYHWRASLSPKATTVMKALSGWAVPRGTSVELNRDAYVQPGPYERAQTWQILVQLGVLSVDEVRAIERYTVNTQIPMGGVL